MKRLNSILIFTFTLFVIGYGQPDIQNTILGLSDTEENEIVKDIRRKYYTINSNENYKKIEKDLMGHSTEGGSATVFYDKENIKKIVAAYYGEGGKAIYKYYFWSDSIFFVFRQVYRYNSPFYVTVADTSIGLEAFDENKTEIIEDRYYFHKNKLIRWLDPDKNKVGRENPEFLKEQMDRIEDVEFIVRETKELQKATK